MDNLSNYKNQKKAILITCYNRREYTLSSLRQLYRLIDSSFDVYLVDDGSTDGTEKAVKVEFPNVILINGNGSLFWNRGMLLAWQAATKRLDYDFFIWLNDDVQLNQDAIHELLSCSRCQSDKAIISGIVVDKNEADILYGGYDKNKILLIPNGLMQSITYLNGNFVLIPKCIYNALGMLDSKYHHDLGDVDYGLRAKKKGFEIFTTKKAIGFGVKNSISRLRKNNSTISERFRQLYSPLGNPPLINFYFRSKHKGLINACSYWIFLHLLNIIPDGINKLLFKDKYQ